MTVILCHQTCVDFTLTEDHSTTTTESTTSAEEESFPVIIVGAGVGAFVMIALLAIGIFVGIYCICYYNRK